MSRLTPRSWRPSCRTPEASLSKRSVRSAPVPTSVTRAVSASRSRSTRSWVPSSSSKSIAAFFRQRLRIQGEGSGALADEGGTDHRPVEVLSPAYRHHRFADMLRAGHAGDVNRLLGKLSRIDVIESDGQRALVVKGDQCRAVAVGLAPPQRLGAARIGDRRA